MLMAFLVALALATPPAPASHAADIRTLRALDQALLDADGTGDKRVWGDAMTADAQYVDENSVVMSRAQLLASLTPLGPGTSGSIAIATYTVRFDGDAALVVHLDDEHENFHGQHLEAHYLTTETWLRRRARWKLSLVHVEAVNATPPAVQLVPNMLASYVGAYRAGPGYEYVIALENGALSGGIRGRKPHPLLAETNDVLFVPHQPRTRLIFERDSSGAVTGFRLRREGEDVVFRSITR